MVVLLVLLPRIPLLAPSTKTRDNERYGGLAAPLEQGKVLGKRAAAP